MKNKGFTMIELLAVIVLLGVLGVIGTVSTTRYLTQSREKSYRIMSQSIYEAYENCAIQGKCSLPAKGSTINNYNIDKLVQLGYLENLRNPSSKRKDCTGTITIKAGSNAVESEYIKYSYTVDLNCAGINKVTYTWPDDKTKK